MLKRLTPSKYQLDVYDAVQNTSKNIVISAGPGSGKTSTIVHASKLLPITSKNIFLAFNNSIVDELKNKLPSHISCSTLHSLGMKSLIKFYKNRMDVNEFKSFNICKDLVKPLEMKKDEEFKFMIPIVELSNMARLTLSQRDEKVLDEIASHYSILISPPQLKICIQLLEALDRYNNEFWTSQKKRQLDFIDMIYLPATLKDIKMERFDVVLVDEGQDLNACQHKLIEKIVKPSGRTIFVGDKKQAIYSFAGADMGSFSRFEKRPNTITLPLSVCYRCGRKIVEEAQKIYPDVEVWEGAKDGIVRDGSWIEIEEGDLVMCRNTAPLISLYFRLLSRRVKVVILGKEIEKGLLNLISKFTNLDTETCFEGLQKYKEELIATLSQKGVKKPDNHPRFIELSEKIAAIKIISQNFQFMFEVEACIKQIFKEDKEATRLCTIHKAKGLESKRAFLYKPELIPSEYASLPWELEQEKNLKFVAYTRAKEEFILVSEE